MSLFFLWIVVLVVIAFVWSIRFSVIVVQQMELLLSPAWTSLQDGQSKTYI
jgi:hypothetical protein